MKPHQPVLTSSRSIADWTVVFAQGRLRGRPFLGREDIKAALVTTHREFQLGELESQPLAVSSATDGPVSRLDAPEQASADAD